MSGSPGGSTWRIARRIDLADRLGGSSLAEDLSGGDLADSTVEKDESIPSKNHRRRGSWRNSTVEKYESIPQLETKAGATLAEQYC